jgi:hypothetical protein
MGQRTIEGIEHQKEGREPQRRDRAIAGKKGPGGAEEP